MSECSKHVYLSVPMSPPPSVSSTLCTSKCVLTHFCLPQQVHLHGLLRLCSDLGQVPLWIFPTLTDPLLSQDSYLIDYFLFLNRYLEVGPPVYFDTTSGYNFSMEAGMNAICSSAGCESFSLTQKIQYASEFPNQ